MIVRHVRQRGIRGKAHVLSHGHHDLDSALAQFLKLDADPSVEYVELVSDKGRDAPAREGRSFLSAQEVADWLNEPTDG